MTLEEMVTESDWNRFLSKLEGIMEWERVMVAFRGERNILRASWGIWGEALGPRLVAMGDDGRPEADKA